MHSWLYVTCWLQIGPLVYELTEYNYNVSFTPDRTEMQYVQSLGIFSECRGGSAWRLFDCNSGVCVCRITPHSTGVGRYRGFVRVLDVAPFWAASERGVGR